MSITIETIMQEISGASFIGLDTTTIPTLLGGKKNPMQGRIKKHNVGASVMVFENKYQNGYENMVRRHLESEGLLPVFEVKPRKWGTRIPGMPIVDHKGKRYLEVIFLKPGVSSYTLDGKPIRKEDIQGLKPSNTEGAQGGLSDGNKVHIRTFAVPSIDRLKVNGREYTDIA